MEKKCIIVVGSSNTDMIIKLKRFPQAGETLLGGTFITAAGGKGANQAVGAAKAGGNVRLIARVGRDMFGNNARADFIRQGIHTQHVFTDRESPSGVALILVAANGENSIAVAPGANAGLSPSDVHKARRVFAGAGALVIQLEIPLDTVIAAADLAVQAGVPVILNPAPARSLPRRLLKALTIITPNEIEAERLTDVKVDSDRAAAKAGDRLLANGVRAVVITLGARGAFVATDGLRKRVPGFKAKAVDTTAAGDIFNGALAVALVEGKGLEPAVEFANAAAAISVTRMGAQTSAPTRREIDRFLAAHRVKMAGAA